MNKTALKAAVVALIAASSMTFAGEGDFPLDIVNRLRVEHDDNWTLTENNEQDSLKIIEELDINKDFNFGDSYLYLRYRPVFIYWFDRDPDDTDFHHHADVGFNQAITPRLDLTIRDSFRVAEVPQIEDRGTLLRDENDYTYNSLLGKLTAAVTANTDVDLAARHVMRSFDKDDIAANNDFDLIVLGLDLRHAITPETTLGVEGRHETIEYDGANRDSDTISVGGALIHQFSPVLRGNVRAGWQQKSFDQSGVEDNDKPYGSGSLTFLPSDATSLTVGAGYSLFESSVTSFSNQERLRYYASLAHDITAKISGYLSAAFIQGDYDRSEVAAGNEALVTADGEQDYTQLSARASYAVNRANSLEAGYTFSDVDSNFEQDYSRNRIFLGWRLKIN